MSEQTGNGQSATGNGQLAIGNGKREEGGGASEAHEIPDVCRCQCLESGQPCGRNVCTGAFKGAETAGQDADTPLKRAAVLAMEFCAALDALSAEEACKAVEVMKARLAVSILKAVERQGKAVANG